jgi:hypothetical protein
MPEVDIFLFISTGGVDSLGMKELNLIQWSVNL